MTDLDVAGVGRLAQQVLDEVDVAVVGKRPALTMVLSGLLAGGHVLLEDFPGLGKTLAARSFAQALGLSFRRVQFTPDLVPADVTGSPRYDQGHGAVPLPPRPRVARRGVARRSNPPPPETP